ncbi:VOC family protein [Pseudarthrobacter sp. SSS035]|uniref:VOC family protein n=1 Tax=Pseudarthrobacter sp. SSS035 TaxID=2931399 RepID=UPI00211176EB|nr:VOC family protein [Pseudarthrobacter sp. SSS035]
MNDESEGALHHIELWVPDLQRATSEWGWILSTLGYKTYQTWPHGISWMRGSTYIVLEESPDLSGRHHHRTAPGLNHLAFNAGSRLRVDALAVDSAEYGWAPLFPEKYPHAGGPDHYAAYLTNSDGFEIELVATH